MTPNMEQASTLTGHQIKIPYLMDWAKIPPIIPPIVGSASGPRELNSNVRLTMEAGHRLGAVLSFIQANCQNDMMDFQDAVGLDHDLTALLIEIKSLPHTSLPTRCAAGLTTCLR